MQKKAIESIWKILKIAGFIIGSISTAFTCATLFVNYGESEGRKNATIESNKASVQRLDSSYEDIKKDVVEIKTDISSIKTSIEYLVKESEKKSQVANVY